MALLELDPLLQPPPASGLFSGVTALPWACSHPGGNVGMLCWILGGFVWGCCCWQSPTS